MDKHKVEVGKRYRITYERDKRHFGKMVELVKVDAMGDCTLRFKNGIKVSYHASWLEPANVELTGASRNGKASSPQSGRG